MKSVIKVSNLYNLDKDLIQNYKYPSIILMENAAHQATIIIKKLISKKDKLLFIIGAGNNGGDGLAIARILNDYNDNINLLKLDKEKTKTKDNLVNDTICNNLNIREVTINDLDLNSYDVIIDAYLGVGSIGGLKNIYLSLFKSINTHKAKRIAIDVPSGLNPKSGLVENVAFKANTTLTMYALKPGFLINDGKDFCGKIRILNLNIPQYIINNYSDYFVFDKQDFMQQNHKQNISKYHKGKVLIIAGSQNYSGAGALAANSTIKSGAGLVYLFSEKIHHKLLPEIIYKEDKFSNILDVLYKNNNELEYDLINIGPGFGDNIDNINALKLFINNTIHNKIILDAEAIQTLENRKYNYRIIITPHLGEFSKLLNTDKNSILDKIVEITMETAKKYEIFIVLKGPSTIITDGNELVFVTIGTNKLSTAGSGDVLTGIMSEYLAKKDFNIHTIASAVYKHSSLVTDPKFNYVTASSLIDKIKK